MRPNWSSGAKIDDQDPLQLGSDLWEICGGKRHVSDPWASVHLWCLILAVGCLSGWRILFGCYGREPLRPYLQRPCIRYTLMLFLAWISISDLKLKFWTTKIALVPYFCRAVPLVLLVRPLLHDWCTGSGRSFVIDSVNSLLALWVVILSLQTRILPDVSLMLIFCIEIVLISIGL